ncbi:hypothetical protein M413DRAFT_27543 [Hebeloma cylindrosporum]|uniref:Uncharacterized protein n=1 Tax=Hebeloma cylindrosporum TaxID=76867 RepID=A0A0C3BZJ5_HEBCY|nr:hypothetical protein M413DRAFT_27543 [Hebeloma cylindrosporum h7]
MLSAPGLSDDEYMRFFDECIAIPVDDPHPCDSTIREDVKVKSEDSLNPPMQLASVRVENLQASVTLSVSALYSTPCASDKQGNKAFLAAAKSLSVVPYSSSYICKAEPAEGHKSLTVPDASDSQSQLVNKRRLTILGPRPTAPVTSGIRRMTSSTVLGKRRKGQEDLAQDSGGKDETEEHIASKRRSKSLTVPDACDSQSQLVNMHRWIILGPPRPPAASLAVTSGTRRMTSSTVLGKRKKGQEDLPQDSGGKDETRENDHARIWTQIDLLSNLDDIHPSAIAIGLGLTWC